MKLLRVDQVIFRYAMLLSEKAAKELNWRATKNVDDMCADTWRWQTMNPNGYDS